MSLRELLNFTHAAFVARFGDEAMVDRLLEPESEAAGVGATSDPVAAVSQNREWLEELRTLGVPVPMPTARG